MKKYYLIEETDLLHIYGLIFHENAIKKMKKDYPEPANIPTERQINKQAIKMINPEDTYACKIVSNASYYSGAIWVKNEILKSNKK